MTSDLRRGSVIENWRPIEVARFEASLSVYGKQFHVASKIVKTKTTREVIEFYYVWKKTGNYKAWKKGYETIIGDDGYALAGVEFQGTGETLESKGGGDRADGGTNDDDDEHEDEEEAADEEEDVVWLEAMDIKGGKKYDDDSMDDEEY